MESTGEDLEGPTAAVFAYDDEISPVKVIAQSAIILSLPKFKFGFFGKDKLDVSALEELAKIPSKDQLQAKFVGVLSSPIYGIVSVLSANIRNLLSVLDQVAKR